MGQPKRETRNDLNGIKKRTLSILSSNLSRYVFGVAILASGLNRLVGRDFGEVHQLRYIVCAAAVAQIMGGALILFRRSAKTGAVVLAAAYMFFALLCVPRIIAAPRGYIEWGNFFYPFSIATGAGLVYAWLSAKWSPETIVRLGRILLGICVASFTLEQAFYLRIGTAVLVPKWLPPSQMFWAVATTVFFAFGAGALLANRMTLLAARLLTIMVLSFGVIVWLPLLLPNLHNHGNWGETTETFAIAGALWILDDLLGRISA